MEDNVRAFDYFEAFSRNVGWITQPELEILRNKRVAIAGMGGVGGVHLLTLTRLGIGKFSLAEYDRFELPNFNRQVGATVSSLRRPKLDVLIEMARDINPSLDIRAFPEGVTEQNLPAFLDGVDLYVDSLDYFAFDARRATYAACARLGVPTTIAVPLGMGVSALTFLPGGMTFEEFFGTRPRDLLPGWSIPSHAAAHLCRRSHAGRLGETQRTFHTYGMSALRRRCRHGSAQDPAQTREGTRRALRLPF
jgi:ThiF family